MPFIPKLDRLRIIASFNYCLVQGYRPTITLTVRVHYRVNAAFFVPLSHAPESECPDSLPIGCENHFLSFAFIACWRFSILVFDW